MHREHLPRRAGLRLTLAAAATFLVSCHPRPLLLEKGHGPPILATSLGPALKTLWDEAGGIGAWGRLGSVHLTYEAVLGPAAPAPPESGGSVAHRWIGPYDLTFQPGDPAWLEVGGAGKKRRHDLLVESPLWGGEPPGSAADYALRSVRVLFPFPFTLAEPGFEFRRDIVAGAAADPRAGFWVVPDGAPSPHRCYWIAPSRTPGGPRAVYYQAEHPFLAGQVLKAVFTERRAVNGVRFATEIRHYRVSAPRPALYPWEPGELPPPSGGAAGEDAPREEDLVLLEYLSDIRTTEKAVDPPVERSVAPGSVAQGGAPGS